jgi:hypothetical protein
MEDAMNEDKYGKYILTQQILPKKLQEMMADPERRGRGTRILYLDDKIIPGAFYLSSGWWLKPSASENEPPPHSHEFDEVLAFFGSNPEDPLDLGGEVEFWLGDEKHLIQKSCLVFVPKGLVHCPLVARRVDRPILHFSTAPANSYSKEES